MGKKIKSKVKIIDYGMGNIASVFNAFKKIGAEVSVITRPGGIKKTSVLVLPGVGAFEPAAKNLRKTGFFDAIKEFVSSNGFLFGICLGFQLLFEESEEGKGSEKGLGLVSGRVIKFRSRDIIIPHIGWNSVSPSFKNFLFTGIKTKYFYFDHSYYPVIKDRKAAQAQTYYGERFCSAVVKGNVAGSQFHPEKSQASGLTMLKNIMRRAEAAC